MTRRIFLALVFLLFALFTFLNARALYEGVFFYLRDVITYDPRAVTPINRAGRYTSIYDLVPLRNAERLAYLQRKLVAPRLIVTSIPISDSQFPNLFVRFKNAPGPYVIFSAHYDKLHDDANYQGASDNTAAVSVLLAAIDELARSFDSAQGGDASNRAFLFTGEEETGLRGAQAFVAYARANALPIRAIINFDNLGRGNLAIRPSAEQPGFVITLPFVSDFVYDGRAFKPGAAYSLANARLAQELVRAQPEIVVYERFTARGDSNVFQASGLETVFVSGDNMHYLELTWHTYADRVELLDERNLDRAFDLILKVK
ncbi:MAG: M20/M25/M40 family metallo-hydrolase [Anaerolineales bacterium]|nr:M20/M25/M40 family metallo-hydrolase [Anaerolineales bacterium]